MVLIANAGVVKRGIDGFQWLEFDTNHRRQVNAIVMVHYYGQDVTPAKIVVMKTESRCLRAVPTNNEVFLRGL